MISIEPNLAQISKLKEKFAKYPPFAITSGLQASADYLNSPVVKRGIYPPSQSGQPFVWSTPKQRRFVFANIRLPSVRTFNLADSGQFKVERRFSSLYVYYENTANYAKWVIGNLTTIIGHITRGWKPVNTLVTDRYRSEVVSRFKDATIRAWDNDSFISGGGGGL